MYMVVGSNSQLSMVESLGIKATSDEIQYQREKTA